MVYFISRNALKIYLKLFFKLKVYGTEKLPKRQPYIVAGNHVSYADPPVVASAVPVGIRFLARHNLFKKDLMGWWVRSMNCIPVKRAKFDMKAMKEALKALANGEVVALFPEGTRSVDGTIKEPKPGIGFMAHKAQVPIIPFYIKGTKAALPKNASSPRLNPISLYFGERIDPASFRKGDESPKAQYLEIAQAVMASIKELKARYEN